MPEIDELEILNQDWEQWPNIIDHQPTLDDFQFLDNGLTNNNWLLKGDNQDYVIRMNASNAKALYLNREAEWHIHDLASQQGLCPNFVYRHPQDKYWIRPYESGTTFSHTLSSYKDFDLDLFLAHAASIYSTIHSTPLSSSWPRINFKERTDFYWQQILEREPTKQSKLIRLKNELDNTFIIKPFTAVLCHMDGNSHNWIIKINESTSVMDVSLIDWEYAAVANPMWDLAVFIDHLELSEKQEQDFINHYGTVSRKALQEAKQQMHYLSQLWYVIQKQAEPESLEKLIQTETF